MNLKPCKHLDYTSEFVECELKTVESIKDIDGNPIRYWQRPEWYPGAPTKVQFCGEGRGRINSVLDCYTAGAMHCYKPGE